MNKVSFELVALFPLSSFLFSRRGASGPLRRFTISNYNDYADAKRGEVLFLLAGCPALWERWQEEGRGCRGLGSERRESDWRRIPPIRARTRNPGSRGGGIIGRRDLAAPSDIFKTNDRPLPPLLIPFAPPPRRAVRVPSWMYLSDARCCAGFSR